MPNILAALSLLLALTPFTGTSASPLEERRAGNQPFYILIRPQDLSGPTIYEEYLYLAPISRSHPRPRYTANAFHGDASLFRIHKGVLLSAQTYLNQTTGTTQTSEWANLPLQAGSYAVWEPRQKLSKSERTGQVHIDFGTNAFVQPDNTNSWYFCDDAAGNQLGLSVGDVNEDGVTCTAVYAFATRQGP